jgi:hypothetical protein
VFLFNACFDKSYNSREIYIKHFIFNSVAVHCLLIPVDWIVISRIEENNLQKVSYELWRAVQDYNINISVNIYKRSIFGDTTRCIKNNHRM